MRGVVCCRDRGDGAQFEHLTRGHPDVGGAQPSHELDRDDGVSAEREEVVLDAYPLEPEDVGKRGAQDLLQCGGGRTGSSERREIRCGKRFLVDLAVGGHRERREDDHGRGHHVLGQSHPERGAEVSGLDGAVGDDVGDQPGHGTLVDVGNDDGGLHMRMGEGRGFDLAEFDAVAADLDLVVVASHVLEIPGVVPAHDVAGAVHALPAGRIGVGDESSGAEPGPAQVSARDTGSADVQFSGDPGSSRTKPTVEHVQPGARRRPTDRDRATGDPGIRRVHGAFGRSVTVERLDTRGGECTPQFVAHGVAADCDLGGPVVCRIEESAVEQSAHEDGHRVDVVDAVGAHVGDEVVHVGPVLVRRQVQRVPFEQPGERGHRGVEREGVRQQYAPLSATRLPNPGLHERVSLCCHEIHEVPVRDDDALRGARRSGGVDDVGGMSRMQWCAPVDVRDGVRR